ncbi:MAG TPA: threonine synthase [Candidatus Ozemobacteraceae bacterium]|nr:threonine synthase [Candidatus Ozemobacteraceae bacterium]
MIWYSLSQPSDTATLLEAAQRSIGHDGGLFMPRDFPRWDDVNRLLTLPPRELWREIFQRLLVGELSSSEIQSLTDEAFSFPLPLTRVSEHAWSLELFHGPTLAFKDFGARFLARILGHATRHQTGKPLTILTATSGDTGAAVAQAFHRVPGIRVVVLFPKHRISPLQERLFATLGDNVLALRVAGSFDDCQSLVKACFRDRELCRHFGLTSANSINPARLLAQIGYYLVGVAIWRQQTGRTDAPTITVPCGNFGNLTAGLLAERLGLPVRRFLIATNANTVVPEYLAGAPYTPRASVATLANAMDVGAPNNWARIRALYQNDDQRLRQALTADSVDDHGIRQAILDLSHQGYLADPHTATAWQVFERHRRPDEPGIFLATAHPAKFSEVLRDILHRDIPCPPVLHETLSRPLLTEDLEGSADELARRMERFCQAGAPAGNISPT